MEENNNISFKHSLESYNKKYKNRRHRILKYTKKQVEEFDKKYQGKLAKNYLLKGKKWTLIGDTYYEIPKAPTFTWFRNLKASTQVITSVLVGGGVVTSVALPLATLNSNNPHAKYFTVTFDLDNPSGDKKIVKVKSGEKVSKIEDPSPKGNAEFVTWICDGVEYDFNKPVTKDLVIVAAYSDTCLVATFLNEDGSTFATKNVPAGTLLSRPTDSPVSSTPDTLAFAGWYEQGDTSKSLFKFDEVKILKSITLCSLWKNYVNVQYKAYDTATENFNEEKVLYDKQAGEKPKANKPDEAGVKKSIGNFDGEITGWYYKKNDTEHQFDDFDADITDLATNNTLTLYPKWKVNTQVFKIVGDHNIDIDSGGSLKLFTGDESEGAEPTEIPLDKTLANNYTVTRINGVDPKINTPNNKLPFDEVGGNFITKPVKDVKHGSDEIIVERQYKYPGGDVAAKVSDTFDFEIGSFNKLDPAKLKEGIASARLDSTGKPITITGDLYIPQRYYDSEKGEWIYISEIAENGFANQTGITKVFISVPTIVIGANALKGCTGLTGDKPLEFEDRSNTWNFDSSELNPSITEDLEKILKGLVVDGNASEKTPTSSGLNFNLIENNTAYEVVTAGATGTLPKDVLIPSKVAPKAGGGWDTTGKAAGSLPVTQVANAAFKQNNIIKTLTIHNKSNIKSFEMDAFNESTLEKVNFLPKKEGEDFIAIKENVFRNTNIKSISLPDTLTTLANNALNYTNITEITLPDSLVECGQYCFTWCLYLTKVNFGSFNLKSKTISKGMFDTCTKLKQIVIPYNVNKIEQSAFLGCSNLQSVLFQDYTSKWSDKAATPTLLYADSNSAEAKLKNATALVKGTAFEKVEDELKNLYSVKVDSSSKTVTIEGFGEVKDIPSDLVIPSYYTFYDEESTSVVTYPVTAIGDSAFKNNTKLVSVTIPNTVTHIGDSAFEGCVNLKSCTLPKNNEFTEISTKMFYNCKKLQTINIPDTIEVIGANAFAIDNADSTYYGLTSAEFNCGLFGMLWLDDSGSPAVYSMYKQNSTNGENLRTGNRNTRLHKGVVVSNAECSFSLTKNKFSTEEGFTADDVIIKYYSEVGYQKTIAGNAGNVTYSIGTVKTGWFGIKSISWSDTITSTVKSKNGLKGTNGEVKRIKITVSEGGKKFESESGVDSCLQISYASPTDNSKFTFKELKDADNNTYGAAVYKKDSSTTFGNKEIVIPSKCTIGASTLDVISVGNDPNNETLVTDYYAFGNITTSSSIIMPKTIKNIGPHALDNSSFTNVSLPSSLVNVGKSAFANIGGKSALNTLVIPSSTKQFDTLVDSDKSEVFSVTNVSFQNPSKLWFVTEDETLGYYYNWTPDALSYNSNSNYMRKNPFIYKTDLLFEPADYYK